MDILIAILLILATASFSLQLCLIPKKKAYMAWILVFIPAIYFAYPLAIKQSFSGFQALLSDGHFISNLIVIQGIESLAGILLGIYLIRRHFNEPVKPYFISLSYFPGIMVFPAIFYLESYAFLSWGRINFQLMAILLSVAIPLGLWGLKWGLEKLIPEPDLRLELKFLLHVFQLLATIILSIQQYKLPVFNTGTDLSLYPLLIFGISVLILIGIGIVIYQYKISHLQKK